MKILEIHIYGYGKFENIVIILNDHLNVFYGENEAGKTTIMSFIHSILFGFPTKQQAELRYEPKKGAKYGGKLVLQHKDKGKVTIERVKGKASGDVSVTLEDGTVGGEPLLRELLYHMDKFLYQSIFSFNLQGLQNVHQLNSEDFGKFLFSTGTIGSDRLLTVETSLQKELDARFKPNGKKPCLNEKMQQVKRTHEELKKAEKQNEEYGFLIEDKEGLQEKIATHKRELISLNKRLNMLKEWQKIAPLFHEMEVLQKQLEELRDFSFPIDGVNRLNQLHQFMKPLQGQIQTLEEKRERLVKQLPEKTPNKKILEKEEEINRLLENVPLYDALKEEETEWGMKLSKVEREIEDLEEKLHLSMEPEKLAKMNTSIFMKEKTADAAKKRDNLRARKEELDRLFNEERAALEKIEIEMKELEKKLLSDDERKEKHEKLFQIENKESLEKEIESIEDKKTWLKIAAQKEKKEIEQQRKQLLIWSVFLLIGGAWGIWINQWFLVVLCGLGFVYLFFLLIHKGQVKKGAELFQEIEKLEEEARALSEQLHSSSSEEAVLLRNDLQADREIQELLTHSKLKWQHQNAQLDKIIQSYESWEEEYRENKAQLLAMGDELSLPEEIALNYLHEAFLLLEKRKGLEIEHQYICQQLKKKRDSIKKVEKIAEELSSLISHDHSFSVRETASYLKNQLNREKELFAEYEETKKELNETDEQLENTTKEYNLLLKEKQQLFVSANVDNEEQYRLCGKKAEKRTELAGKVESLEGQIEVSSLEREEILQLSEIGDIQREMERTVVQIENCENQIQQFQEQLSDIRHKIALLEEGTKYTELLHRFKQLKSELDMEARNWAKFALANEILNRTIVRFKQSHLPKMLKRAEEHLAFLTGGNYTRIFPKDESSGFFIQGRDHILYEANELSQATTEQIYVSIRFALAETLYKKYSFPILIDDSFVNFDHIRFERVIQLLKNIRENQILFFTCHQHFLPYFGSGQIIAMDRQNMNSLQV